MTNSAIPLKLANALGSAFAQRPTLLAKPLPFIKQLDGAQTGLAVVKHFLHQVVQS